MTETEDVAENPPPDGPAYESVDPDVDVDDPAQRPDFRAPREVVVLAMIALGGVLGAEARYGLSRALTHPTGTWPWSTLIANVVGSALIGLLMVVLLERRTAHPLIRPFLGVGVLGGFTTFSTFSLDAQDLLMADRPALALAYAAVSLAGCLGATAGAVTLTRARLSSRVAP